MLISESYRALNKKLHESNPGYGKSGARLLPSVLMLCKEIGSQDILDYGCGKRTLERALGFEIKNYDPAIEGVDDTPEPADLVVCSDVLEHIEPETLDDVLDDLKRVIRMVGLFTICIVPAQKVLEDGRNAHLIQQDWRWWSPKILARFEVLKMELIGSHIWLIVKKDGQINGERKAL